LDPVDPALQMQALGTVLASKESELAGHDVHIAASAVEYVPFMQFWHDVIPIPSTGEYWPAGQLLHSASQLLI